MKLQVGSSSNWDVKKFENRRFRKFSSNIDDIAVPRIKAGYTQRFLGGPYLNVLLKWPSRIVVLIIFFGFFAFSIYYIAAGNLSVSGVVATDLLSDDSYVTLYLDTYSDAFGEETATAQIVIGPKVDYTLEKTWSQLDEIVTTYNAAPLPHVGPVISWYDALKSYSVTTGQNITSQSFYTILHAFLNTSGSNHQSSFSFEGESIKYSRFYTETLSGENSVQKQQYMDDLLSIQEQIEITSFVYYDEYIFLQSDKALSKTMVVTLLAALAVVAFCLLLFVGIRSAFFATVSIIMIFMDLFCIMALCHLNLGTVSFIGLNIGLGLCVVYCAHIVLAYNECKLHNRLDRSKAAVRHIAASVFSGGVGTFLGVLVLVGAQSSAYRSFFNIFLGIVLFGLAHGFILLPVIYSLLGSQASLEEEAVYLVEHRYRIESILKPIKRINYCTNTNRSRRPNNKAFSDCSIITSTIHNTKKEENKVNGICEQDAADEKDLVIVIADPSGSQFIFSDTKNEQNDVIGEGNERDINNDYIVPDIISRVDDNNDNDIFIICTNDDYDNTQGTFGIDTENEISETVIDDCSQRNQDNKESQNKVLVYEEDIDDFMNDNDNDTVGNGIFNEEALMSAPRPQHCSSSSKKYRHSINSKSIPFSLTKDPNLALYGLESSITQSFDKLNEV